jgi:hypothetical protein
MDIGKAFGFVFDDDQWITKILVAAAILAVGILFSWLLLIPLILAALLLNGYGIEIVRRVIKGASPVLPEWGNWGELLMDGLKLFIIQIVYALPMILVGVCLGPLAGVTAEEAQEVSSMFSAFMSCLNVLWGIVLALFLPAAVAFYVAEGEVSAAFRFGDVFGFVRDNFGTYVVVAVLSWVAGIIGGLGFLVCGVGALVTIPYAGWVTNHLTGQAYLEASGKTAQPAVEVEPEPEDEAAPEELA